MSILEDTIGGPGQSWQDLREGRIRSGAMVPWCFLAYIRQSFTIVRVAKVTGRVVFWIDTMVTLTPSPGTYSGPKYTQPRPDIVTVDSTSRPRRLRLTWGLIITPGSSGGPANTASTVVFEKSIRGRDTYVQASGQKLAFHTRAHVVASLITRFRGVWWKVIHPSMTPLTGTLDSNDKACPTPNVVTVRTVSIATATPALPK